MNDGCITSLWEGNQAWLQPNFCSVLYTDGLVKPRGLHINKDDNEILLVERGKSRVIRLDDDGASIVPVANTADLNHGIELAGGYLYASTPTTVYRWPYQTGQAAGNNLDYDEAQEVIVGMDRNASDELGAPGGHTTRTLAFDADGRWLYVSIGSLGNVDGDSFRSRIRRFDITVWDDAASSSSSSASVVQQPLNFNDGEVFADGLRNEVGLAFDSHGDLWGVENAADRLYRDDLGGDIHNDNPSEELNRFREDQAGETWGYPHCWSEYCLPVENGGSGMKGANTPWAWPSFFDSEYTDEWCRENTNESVMSMPAHSAPLGITFYEWRDMSQEEECRASGGFPKSMDKYAFIAFHGSWNRRPPTGYKVVFVPFDGEGNPTALPIDLFRHNGDEAKWTDPVRPVDVQFDRCGSLFVTEDGTGSVIKITYSGGYFDEYVPIETDVVDGASCSPFQLPSSSPIMNSPTKIPSASQDTVDSVSVPAEIPVTIDSSEKKPPSSGPSVGQSEEPSAASGKSWTLAPDDNICCPSPSNNGCSIPNSVTSLLCICLCIFSRAFAS